MQIPGFQVRGIQSTTPGGGCAETLFAGWIHPLWLLVRTEAPAATPDGRGSSGVGSGLVTDRVPPAARENVSMMIGERAQGRSQTPWGEIWFSPAGHQHVARALILAERSVEDRMSGFPAPPTDSDDGGDKQCILYPPYLARIRRGSSQCFAPVAGEACGSRKTHLIKSADSLPHDPCSFSLGGTFCSSLCRITLSNPFLFSIGLG